MAATACIPRATRSTTRLGRVDGELQIGNNARIDAADGKRVVVSQGARFQGSAEVNCDFECEALEVGHRGLQPVRINGNLIVHRKLEISETVEVSGAITAGEIIATGKLKAQSIRCGALSTPGNARISGSLVCDAVEIGKTTEVKGDLRAGTLDVIGELLLWGTLEVSDSMVVYGSADISKTVRSESLKIGGQFRAARAEVVDEVDLAGEAWTAQGLTANTVVIATGSRCLGPIVANRVEIGSSGGVLADWKKTWAGQSLKVRAIWKGTRVEDIYAKHVHLGASSQSGRVFAETIQFERGAVADEIQYTGDLQGPTHTGHFRHIPRRVTKLPTNPRGS